MNYLVKPDVSEEIDGRETDPLTGNIIGAAIAILFTALWNLYSRLTY